MTRLPDLAPRDEPDPEDLHGLRVLFVNWRDEGHPQAGGAEVFCGQVGRALVARGAEVSLFTSRARGQAEQEVVGGIATTRRGGRWSVYAQALRHLHRVRGEVDLVVDCQNGLPFFAPLVVGRAVAVVLLIHHVHQEQFAAHFPPVLARVGQFLEGPASRAVYRSRAVAVVSPSTRTEVRRRLGLRGPLHVVPNGLALSHDPGPADADEGGPRTRSAAPSLVCVGRLVVHKRTDLLLQALPRVLETHPDLVVHLVGDGPERARLQHLAAGLGLDGAVRFWGRVTPELRDDLLAGAWLTVTTSMGEGWGLGVLEAAAAGVPAVASDVPGLRDAVLDGSTGWLVGEGDDLAVSVLAALAVLTDPAEAERWSARCTRWAGGFTWEQSARRLLAVGAAEQARRWRRLAPRDRRRHSDLVVWAEVPVADREHFAVRAGRALRREDLWQLGDGRAYLLCAACDEHDLDAVAARLGVPVASAQIATGAQLLGTLAPLGTEQRRHTGPARVPAQSDTGHPPRVLDLTDRADPPPAGGAREPRGSGLPAAPRR